MRTLRFRIWPFEFGGGGRTLLADVMSRKERDLGASREYCSLGEEADKCLRDAARRSEEKVGL